MNEPKYTPGPWKAGLIGGPSGLRPAIYGEKHGEQIADMSADLIPEDENNANARLIAAAPELLEALQALFEHCAMTHKHWGENSNLKESNAAQEAARAAISKALGDA